MPVRVKFLHGGAGVEYRSEGVVTGQEIVDTNTQVYTRENLLRLKYKLIDRTACTEYQVTPDDILRIADQDKQAATINPHIIILLVSTTSVQYGMSRMWQSYTDELDFQTEIFKDRASADAWLKDHVTLPED